MKKVLPSNALIITCVVGVVAATSAPALAQGGGGDGPRGGAPIPDPVVLMNEASRRVAKIEIQPGVVEVTMGDTVTFQGILTDADGNRVRGARWAVGDPSTPFSLNAIKDQSADTYQLWGTAPGVSAMTLFIGFQSGPNSEPNWRRMGLVRVVVHDYPVAHISVAEPAFSPYAGTSFQLEGEAITTMGTRHATAILQWHSTDPSMASVSPDGWVTLVKPGAVELVVEAEGHATPFPIRVLENPVARVTLSEPRSRVRTGDVALAFSVEEESAGSRAGATVFPEGAFVAEEPGTYVITAGVGGPSASTRIEVFPREVSREMTLVAHGSTGASTTDLWVFEGLDGRDYAYTGTMSAAIAHIWDVTDPANPVRTDSVTVDGRRVNDVKVNDDRTLAIITSESASNRRNGITLLDIREPAHPRKISHYTDGLTGGVHNVWFVGDLVYAVNDGTLDVHIIDISDPEHPAEVGRWGLDRPGRYLHDVSVADGLAYLSYWDDGVVILDVGDGRWGGTPIEPVMVSSASYRYDIGGRLYGNTHHALRHKQYVFTGDEIFGCPGCRNPRGYIHVMDVSDIENPVEVAKFELPNAGSHNMWVEDDVLYIAYYSGGLVTVDVSGDLRGDLYAQGRMMGRFMTTEPGRNSTMAWGPQPYKGNIFVSDMRSGLWVVRMQPRTVIP